MHCALRQLATNFSLTVRAVVASPGVAQQQPACCCASEMGIVVSRRSGAAARRTTRDMRDDRPSQVVLQLEVPVAAPYKLSTKRR